MPAIIDHEQRRREVCDIAARLIARGGVEGITVRDVAREAGCSTRIVSHYFKNKRELLLLTFREFALRSLAQGEEALTSGSDLQACLEAFLPLDEPRQMSWRVWLAFWGTIANDPEFSSEQILRGRQMREFIKRLLATGFGPRSTSHDGLDFEADQLLTVIVGIATQGTFDPERWTPERQRALLRAEIGRLEQLVATVNRSI